MKNIILLLIALSLISSCSKNFLEERPKGTISPENFYSTEEDLISGLNAVYQSVSPIFRRPYQVLGEYTADLTLLRASGPSNMREFSMYFGTPEGRYNGRMWTRCYQLIANANAVIDNLTDKEELNESLKNRADAEARFFRGLAYYYLVNFFGDIPLIQHQINTVDDAFQERSSKADVLEQVVTDLKIAKQNLPEKSGYSGTDLYRPSKGATRMLLAKVYITLQEWQAAKSELTEIISSGEYDLEPKYTDVWKVANNGLAGVENIMEIYFPSGELDLFNRSFFQQLMLPRYFTRAFEHIYASEQLIEKFDKENDERFKEIFIHNTFNGYDFREENRYMAVYKWYDPDYYPLTVDLRGPYETNWILFRYADVLLSMAEVLTETNGTEMEIENYLNKVRNRAGIGNIDLAGMSKEQIIQEIFDERARELYMEGHRFIDLKNRGYDFFTEHVEPRLGATIPETKLVFPIPTGEVQANPNLDQNPGY